MVVILSNQNDKIKSPFGSGVVGDAIRNFIGYWYGCGAVANAVTGVSGPFVLKTVISRISNWAYYDQTIHSGFDFNPSFVVPTGPDNAPRTLSLRYWRRVA